MINYDPASNLTLLPEGHRDLKLVSKEVDFDCVDTSVLIDLVEKMKAVAESHRAVGLAAIQVGIPIRLFILKTADGFQEIINPEVTEVSESLQAMGEGCLSFPGLYLNVRRSPTIMVKYQNLSGHVIETTLSDLPAQCFQHELDHLDGITFDERVSRLMLTKAKEKRKKKNPA